ncbi:MAG TPA: hypothetical protein VH081_11415 [Solirubrobacteraceae bacterium]|nr:hypothetical protein [Solirubrobacteraceae bacterium]
MIAFAFAVIATFALSACGAAPLVKPKKVAFEPTIVSCSPGTRPAQCTSANLPLLRRAHEARSHRCPQDEPDVLVKTDGTLLCVAGFPSAAPSAIDLSPPSAVRAGGKAAVGEFEPDERLPRGPAAWPATGSRRRETMAPGRT